MIALPDISWLCKNFLSLVGWLDLSRDWFRTFKLAYDCYARYSSLGRNGLGLAGLVRSNTTRLVPYSQIRFVHIIALPCLPGKV